MEDKHLVEKIQKELETEFIPELYDKTMTKMFGDKYYEASDDDAKDAEKNKAIDLNLMKDEEEVDGQIDEEEYERAVA
jgi:hypothetical protein